MPYAACAAWRLALDGLGRHGVVVAFAQRQRPQQWLARATVGVANIRELREQRLREALAQSICVKREACESRREVFRHLARQHATRNRQIAARRPARFSRGQDDDHRPDWRY